MQEILLIQGRNIGLKLTSSEAECSIIYVYFTSIVPVWNVKIIYILIGMSTWLWVQNGSISCVNELRMQEHWSTEILSNTWVNGLKK